MDRKRPNSSLVSRVVSRVFSGTVLLLSMLGSQSLLAQQESFNGLDSEIGGLPLNTDTAWATLQTGGGLDSRPANASTFSLFGGWNFSDERDRFGVGFYPTIRFDEAATAGISLGKRIGSRLRTELEFTWRRNVANPAYDPYIAFISLPYGGGGGFDGHLNTYSGMANVIFDFDRAEGRLLTPYIGAGLGMAYIDTDISFQGKGATVSNETAFAYQALGGVALKLSQRSDFFVEYRYFATDSQEYKQPSFDTGYSIQPNREFLHSFQHHSFLMGIRFHF